MKNNKLIEYLFWLVSYYPVIAVVLYKSFESEINGFVKINIEELYTYLEFIAFGIIAVTTLIFYKLVLSLFVKRMEKKIKKYKIKQSISVNSFNKLSLDKYSFFILSLMLPFIFESTDNNFDVLLILSLITVLIHVMVKMNQIMVNPIFLFSNLNIYEASISKDPNVSDIKVAIITSISIQELEQIDKFVYYEYFNKVYFLMGNS